MRWRNVLSTLVVVLLLSCKATTSQLSLSELDSNHHHEAVSLFDTINIEWINNAGSVCSGSAATMGASHPANNGSYRIVRHAVLADSAEWCGSITRKGTTNTAKAPVVTTPQETTLIAYAFFLLFSVITVVILRFLIKRL